MRPNGSFHPPRNSAAWIPPTTNIAAYSAKKKKREPQAAVLGVEAGDQLRFALGQVERRALVAREAGDEVDEEREEHERVAVDQPGVDARRPGCGRAATMFSVPAAITPTMIEMPSGIS